MKLLLFTSAAALVVVWVIGIAWQVGYFKCLSTSLSKGRIGENPQDKESRVVPPQGVLASGRGPESVGVFERRSLTYKARGILRRGLLFGLGAVLAIASLILIARQLPLICFIAGLVIVFTTVIFMYMRSTRKFLFTLISTTACSKCGKVPMDYRSRSGDGRRLLVCAHCRIEWDLGPTDL